jgi:hypothetical protein
MADCFKAAALLPANHNVVAFHWFGIVHPAFTHGASNWTGDVAALGGLTVS